MDKESGGKPRTIQSVERACTILEKIRQANRVTLTELEENIDLSLGTLQTYMNTLCANGLVIKEGRTYRLAHQFLTYGEHVRNNLPLYRAGREVADTIAHETGKNAHLITHHNGQEVTVYQSFGEGAVGSDIYIWHQAKLVWQLHWSASGKAILAHLPQEDVAEVVEEHGLERRTPNTITDDQKLYDELEQIREQGYALNDEEEISGLRAVAAPIHDPDHDLVGSVSISAPISQMPDEEFYDTYPDYVREKANIIEIELQTVDVTSV
ncbi:IclR family transcriptional regulator [Natrialba swarupiae]|nr:IclR family transcriptional regulator [Natrialba swarupiae]